MEGISCHQANSQRFRKVHNFITTRNLCGGNIDDVLPKKLMQLMDLISGFQVE